LNPGADYYRLICYKQPEYSLPLCGPIPTAQFGSAQPEFMRKN